MPSLASTSASERSLKHSARSTALLLDQVLTLVAMQGGRGVPATWGEVLAPHCLNLCRSTRSNTQLWARLVDVPLRRDGTTRLMAAARRGDDRHVAFLLQQPRRFNRRHMGWPKDFSQKGIGYPGGYLYGDPDNLTLIEWNCTGKGSA